MLQSFELKIDENAIEEGALKLLKSLRPKWIPENIKFMIFTEGISNKLIGCYEIDDKGKHDAICIRIYGQNSDVIIDRSAENNNIAMLQTVGCAEPIYCKFANGIAYRFVPGTCLDANTTFEAGFSNSLVVCYEKEDKDKCHAICIRVYGQKSHYIIDRKVEIQNILMLHSLGCAAPIYCQFTNGIAYRFVPGDVLDDSMIQEAKVTRLIAKEMVKLHSVDPARILGDNNTVSVEPMLFKKSRHFLNLVPDKFTDDFKDDFFKKNFKSKKELLAEVDLLQEKLVGLGSPVRFCHNDLLLQNIVYNKEEEKVTFIDHEYGAFNYIAFDIGDHFCEYAGVDTVDFTLYPDREYQLEWLKAYLEYKAEAEGRKASTVTSHDIETLYVQVNQFALAAHFFWGSWGLVQASISNLEFDYIGYAKLKLDEYFNRKDEFLALTVPS